MAITLIMPVYNEAENLQKQKAFFTSELINKYIIELIIVDGGSTDESIAIAKSFAHVAVVSPQKGRAQQMNYGATLAIHQILYFVHADATINETVFSLIEKNVDAKTIGGFRYVFDQTSKWLKINEKLTGSKGIWAGAGDQTLFITKQNFNLLNGYNPTLMIMEDFDIVKRAKKLNINYFILPHQIIVSARKYSTNSWLRVQLANAIIVIAWKLGASQAWMKRNYKKMLHPF